MTKTYSCRDVGVDSDWKISGVTEDNVMASVAEHAALIHSEIELTRT
jgi:predicted small metal-binding protein